MKFPKVVRNRKSKVEATIYGRKPGYPYYRISWRAAGRRVMKTAPTYSKAKQIADAAVADLASGSQKTALTARQASDALAGVERLQNLFQATGFRASLLSAVSAFADAITKLNGHPLDVAVRCFLAGEAVVKRVSLAVAAAEFLTERKPLSESKDGKRPKHSPIYEANIAMWVNEFVDSFPNYAVCDLAREHIDLYLGKFGHLGAKSRNDRRATLKMLLSWFSAKDYLAENHRLFGASKFKREEVNLEVIDFYRPAELRQMLNNANDELRPVIALAALGGLRREEILRLSFENVWRVKQHIEISAAIAKGRSRRLVPMCASLKKWLAPYRTAKGPIWGKSADVLEEAMGRLRDGLGIQARRNGLRHAFCTFHMAKHNDENLTAAISGNSPQMLHQHYRGAATRAEAVKWFSVKPVKARGNVIHLKEAV